MLIKKGLYINQSFNEWYSLFDRLAKEDLKSLKEYLLKQNDPLFGRIYPIHTKDIGLLTLLYNLQDVSQAKLILERLEQLGSYNLSFIPNSVKNGFSAECITQSDLVYTDGIINPNHSIQKDSDYIIKAITYYNYVAIKSKGLVNLTISNFNNPLDSYPDNLDYIPTLEEYSTNPPSYKVRK